MTIVEAQRKIANEFLTEVKDGDFETFEEMRDCYWWTSKDIKEEVRYMLKDTGWFIDDFEGTDVMSISSGESISYRSFIAGVYKLMKGENANV